MVWVCMWKWSGMCLSYMRGKAEACIVIVCVVGDVHIKMKGGKGGGEFEGIC